MSERKTPVRMPGYKFRVFLSVVLLVAGFAFQGVYSAIEGPFEGKLATGQLNGTTEEYVVGAWFATHNVTGMAWTAVFVLLAFVWVPFAIRVGRYQYAVRNIGTAILLLVSLGLAGCGPAPKVFYAEIGGNETLIIPNLQGETESETLNSLAYLKNATIQAKRIVVPMDTVTIDHGFGNYVYRSSIAVIRVDRSPVSCEWTKTETTGTSGTNEALKLKSLDGIFGLAGTTVTGHITEGDEGLYCTSYGVVKVEPNNADVKTCISPAPDQVGYLIPEYVAKPIRSVLEHDVRVYLQYCLSEQYGANPVEKTRAELVTYFTKAKAKTTTFFAALGVTIDSIGSQEGVSYLNPLVQSTIDDRVRAVLDQKTATNELDKAKQTNMKNVAMAEAERDAATKFLQSVSAMQFRQYLELKKLEAETFAARAEKWDKQLPSIILPAGGSAPLLLQLDAKN